MDEKKENTIFNDGTEVMVLLDLYQIVTEMMDEIDGDVQVEIEQGGMSPAFRYDVERGTIVVN